jgi:hypothetical protein
VIATEQPTSEFLETKAESKKQKAEIEAANKKGRARKPCLHF